VRRLAQDGAAVVIADLRADEAERVATEVNAADGTATWGGLRCDGRGIGAGRFPVGAF
jgi:NAD(P)-dependent dehydrogenase (short-subunit alcohol dehydrogenase family)